MLLLGYALSLLHQAGFFIKSHYICLSACLHKAFWCLVISCVKGYSHPNQPTQQVTDECPSLRWTVKLKLVSTCTIKDWAWCFFPPDYIKPHVISIKFCGIISQLDQLILDYNHIVSEPGFGFSNISTSIKYVFCCGIQNLSSADTTAFVPHSCSIP